MKKTLFTLFKIFLFILFLSQADVFASVLEPVVSASLNKQESYIGDIIKFTIKAELPENAYIATNKEIIFENFDILGFSVEHISEKPNIYLITFDIAAYKTGTLHIEPVGITYINASGSKRMFFTPQSQVIINSMLNDGGKDIKDIKPLKKLAIKPAYAAGIAVMIIFIGILLFFIIEDVLKKSAKENAEFNPQLEALNLLDELLHCGIIENGEARIFYYRAAEILRKYISVKYKFNAMEMTSAELLKKLEEIVAISMTKRDIKHYLGIFDLARYAGLKLSKDDMIESLEKTKEFIRKI
jgi:hypothetical protein